MPTALNLRNFDEDIDGRPRPRPRPAARTYSEDEVREMVRAAHDRGLKEGRAEGVAEGEATARDAADTTLADTIERMTAELGTLAGDHARHRALTPRATQPKLILASRFERESAFASASSRVILPSR